MKTLIAYADEIRSGVLGRMLAQDGHSVVRARDGLCAIEAVWRDKPDLVFLGAALPVVDGLTVLRRLREAGNRVTVIAVAAQSGDRALLEAVQAGADDYLVLPPAPDDLRARILTAGIRRGRPTAGEELHFEDLVLDLRQRQAWRSGRPLHLTGQEFSLLQALAESPHQIVSRAEIGRRLHGREPATNQRSVEIAISRLRRKVDAPSLPALIRTTRRSGYSLGYGPMSWKTPVPPVRREESADGSLPHAAPLQGQIAGAAG